MTLFLAGEARPPVTAAPFTLGSAAAAKEVESLRAECDRLSVQLQDEIDRRAAAESDAKTKLLHLAERERASKQAAALADEAATRAGEEYAAGTGDVLTLIEATQFQIDSASQHAAIRRMRLENRVDLHLALGGDFSAGK
jgi:outer membrane protein TolC